VVVVTTKAAAVMVLEEQLFLGTQHNDKINS
jgi:hypothetical protein